MSLIIDGMDQSKTQIPHFVHASKYTASVWKLRVHLVGVIVHGIVSMAFFDLFEYSHSTNLTLSVLMGLYMMRESLPDVLYLQIVQWKTKTGITNFILQTTIIIIFTV